MNDEIKVKNDYNLINALLEDGSESAILKLKMIVDFDEFKPEYVVSGPYGRVIKFRNNIENIDDNNIDVFLKFCGKNLVNEWMKVRDLDLLTGIDETKKYEIVKSICNMGINFSNLIITTYPIVNNYKAKSNCEDDDLDEFLKSSL